MLMPASALSGAGVDQVSSSQQNSFLFGGMLEEAFLKLPATLKIVTVSRL
jgi:hypothetical protein